MKRLICLAALFQLAASPGFCADGTYLGKAEVREGYGQLVSNDDTGDLLKIDGELVRLTGDGKFEPAVVREMSKLENLIRDGVITDIRDPRLAELLRSQLGLEALRDKSEAAGGNHVPADVNWGKNWQAHSVPTIAPWWGLSLNNPNLAIDDLNQNYIEISKGVNENGYVHLVRISVRAGRYYQTIFAEFRSMTGEIYGSSIKEILIVRRK